jgi:hypothetical protein
LAADKDAAGSAPITGSVEVWEAAAEATSVGDWAVWAHSVVQPNPTPSKPMIILAFIAFSPCLYTRIIYEGNQL